jgi:hypothetical protein
MTSKARSASGRAVKSIRSENARPKRACLHQGRGGERRADPKAKAEIDGARPHGHDEPDDASDSKSGLDPARGFAVALDGGLDERQAPLGRRREARSRA